MPRIVRFNWLHTMKRCTNQRPAPLDLVTGRFRFWRPHLRLSGTYTQSGRNQDSLLSAAQVLSQVVESDSRPASEVEVLVVGPGAVLKMPLFSKARGKKPGKLQRRVESVMRKLPLPKKLYASFECQEVVASLRATQLEPVLTVLDRSDRVLDIVKASISGVVPDLIQSSLDRTIPNLNQRFDLVVCCNVFYHITRRNTWLTSRQRVLDYCSDTCVFVCDDPRVFSGTEFAEVAPKVYVRKSASRRPPWSALMSGRQRTAA